MKVMGLFPPAPMPRLHEGVRLGPMLTVNISERSERLESRVRALEVSYSGDDVDDRLGGHTGHRRWSNVVDAPVQPGCKRLSKRGLLGLKKLGPLRVVWNNYRESFGHI
jgi:hypothetical protein